MAMLGDAIAGFLARGYAYIGMDHFALPGDALAVAKREGRLHRNFQGYSTQPDCDLVGLGVSAIGRVGGDYYQNAKTCPSTTRASPPAACRSCAATRSTRRRAARATPSWP
jgi:oxygen-independent coproporphyrinogen-3 oxidase